MLCSVLFLSVHPRAWGEGEFIGNSILLTEVILNRTLLGRENGRKVQDGKEAGERRCGEKKGENNLKQRERENKEEERKIKITKTAALISMHTYGSEYFVK